MERLRGTAAPIDPGHQLGRRRVLPRRRSVPMTRLFGTGGPTSWGPASPAHEAVCAYAAPAGDGGPERPGSTNCGEAVPPRPSPGAPSRAGSLHRLGLTNCGDGESRPGGGRRLWSACGGRPPPSPRALRLGGRGVQPTRPSVPPEVCEGRQSPSARAHQLGRRGVVPRRWSARMERPRWTTAPSGPDPPARGTGSAAHNAVSAYGALAGGQQPPAARSPPARGTRSPALWTVGAYGASARDNRPHWPAPTNWGDGESCPGGGPCLWSVSDGRQPQAARANQLVGRGVLPRRRSVPMECVPQTGAPSGPRPPPGGTGSRAEVAVNA